MAQSGKNFRKNLYLFIISFFNTGLISKKMPGTIGSLFATLIVLLLPKSPILLFSISIMLFIIGVVICDLYIIKYKYETNRDPSYVVIDEACGIFLSCSIIYYFGFTSVTAILINFLLFRLFDILKPFPIRDVGGKLKDNDRTVGLGIMLDDILAAIMSAMFLVSIGVLWAE